MSASPSNALACRRYYHKLRAAGLCVVCRVPVEDGRALCPVHRKVNNQRSKQRRRKALAVPDSVRPCTHCASRPPTPGYRSCKPCRAGVNAHHRRRAAERRLELQERYATNKANGVCTRCSKADAEPGRIHCGPCAEKDRAEHARLRLARKRAAAASGEPRCGKCLVRPPEPGKRTCKVCRERRTRDVTDRRVERFIREGIPACRP